MNLPEFNATSPIFWVEDGDLSTYASYSSKMGSRYAEVEIFLTLTLGDQMRGVHGLSRCPDVHLTLHMRRLGLEMRNIYRSVSEAMEALDTEFLPHARDTARAMAEDFLAVAGS